MTSKRTAVPMVSMANALVGVTSCSMDSSGSRALGGASPGVLALGGGKYSPKTFALNSLPAAPRRMPFLRSNTCSAPANIT